MKSLSRYLGIAATLVAASYGMGAEAQERRFAYSAAIPPQHVLIQTGVLPFFQELEARTNGALKWNVLTGGAGGDYTKAFDAVTENQVDGGIVASVYSPAKLPDSNLIGDLGLMGEDPLAMLGAHLQVVFVDLPEISRTIIDAGMIPLGTSVTPAGKFMCRAEVTSVRSLQGKRYNASMPWTNIVGALNGTQITMGSGEIYDALQKGILDCTIGPAAWLKSNSLADIAKYVSNQPMGANVGTWIFSMNKKVWDSLKPQERALIWDMIPTATARMNVAYQKQDAEVMIEMKSKIKPFDLDPSMREALQRAQQSSTDRAVEQARKRGVKDPDKIVSAYRAALAKWAELVKTSGLDEKAFEALLRREVYDKVKL